ncbi:hypothetical protein SAMN06265222_101264 [Neorhodopirellula lusitana]|uniref:Uncharacterized protein n=1 Tax=Neorhodopirellula lusitana TaxID=445327 RepID=A0ABY1PQB8_9BACT|nr:hypothetical protein [Neorhodopirellula lusitana]SMP39170.1 hypothetical protein SAMN06265222_101264 [Neorhodopirellula lusitana]
MNPLPLGPLYESQTRIRQEFLDFTAQWQKTKEGWRDEPARRFEEQSLNTLTPTLTRVSAAMQTFAEEIRSADQALHDPEANLGDM